MLGLILDIKRFLGISKDVNKQVGIVININNIEFPDSKLPSSFSPDKHIWYNDRIVDLNDNLPKYKDAPKEQYSSGELIV